MFDLRTERFLRFGNFCPRTLESFSIVYREQVLLFPYIRSPEVQNGFPGS